MGKRDDRVRVTLLGTGTSTGVPVIGCRCRVCTSDDVRDRRTRSACIVEANGVTILVDTGPDFRFQMLREGIRHVDAVLFTHHHFDHVAGIDDLRPFTFDNPCPMPCYARENTVAALQARFTYIFGDSTYPGAPHLVLRAVDNRFQVTGRGDPSRSASVTPISVLHGSLPLFGYRIGRFAYITDASFIPDESYALLEGLDVLVLNALREERHPTHFAFEEAVRAAQRIGARKTWFTHVTHSLLHEESGMRFPENTWLGYDGLRFETGG